MANLAYILVFLPENLVRLLDDFAFDVFNDKLLGLRTFAASLVHLSDPFNVLLYIVTQRFEFDLGPKTRDDPRVDTTLPRDACERC